MKTVCFVNFDMSVIGGAEKVTMSLANEFCNRYHVFIYSINGRNKEIPYTLDKRVKYYAELENKTRLREMIEGVFHNFNRFVKENNIDIVITMGNYPALIVSFTKFFNKAKYVFCDHGALMNQWHQKDITLIRFWDAVTSKRVVALTEQTKKDYIRKFHLSEKKVECIYNWIGQEVLECREEYDAESKYILTVGRFGKEKGYDMLLKVAKKVLPKNPEWTWHLYGVGETFDEIKEQALECGLEKQLIFKGNVKDAYRLYHKYAFLVLPSYREGMPLVLLEAKAIGLPMVSFDIMTGPNEIIRDGEDGFLIEPYDCDKMAEKMEVLMKNMNLRRKQSQETCVGLGKFSQEQIMDKWENLIETLVGDKIDEK